MSKKYNHNFEKNSHAYDMRLKELQESIDEDQREVDEREGWIEESIREIEALKSMPDKPA